MSQTRPRNNNDHEFFAQTGIHAYTRSSSSCEGLPDSGRCRRNISRHVEVIGTLLKGRFCFTCKNCKIIHISIDKSIMNGPHL